MARGSCGSSCIKGERPAAAAERGTLPLHDTCCGTDKGAMPDLRVCSRPKFVREVGREPVTNHPDPHTESTLGGLNRVRMNFGGSGCPACPYLLIAPCGLCGRFLDSLRGLAGSPCIGVARVRSSLSPCSASRFGMATVQNWTELPVAAARFNVFLQGIENTSETWCPRGALELR